MTAKSLKKTLEEENADRGSEMELPTGGAPLRVIVGTADSRCNRPKETALFTLEDAKDLKRKRGFSHEDMAEVFLYHPCRFSNWCVPSINRSKCV